MSSVGDKRTASEAGDGGDEPAKRPKPSEGSEQESAFQILFFFLCVRVVVG